MLETQSSLFLKSKERRRQLTRNSPGSLPDDAKKGKRHSLMDVRAQAALHHVHAGKPVIPGKLASTEELIP